MGWISGTRTWLTGKLVGSARLVVFAVESGVYLFIIGIWFAVWFSAGDPVIIWPVLVMAIVVSVALALVAPNWSRIGRVALVMIVSAISVGEGYFVYRHNHPAVPPSSRFEMLKQKTDNLAVQILDFVEFREGPINEWKQQAVAQAFVDAIHNNPSGYEQFQERLNAWNNDTQRRFEQLYWPQVMSLSQDLADDDVDVEPLTNAAALDGPRRIGFMLSVVASRIGKRPPFGRTITPLEAKAIVRDIGTNDVFIYASLSDPNSKEIAEVLRSEFQRQGHRITSTVLPITPGAPKHGIHIVYPYQDMATALENLSSELQLCDWEVFIDIRPPKRPSPAIRIEVWPSSGLDPNRMMGHRNFLQP